MRMTTYPVEFVDIREKMRNQISASAMTAVVVPTVSVHIG